MAGLKSSLSGHRENTVRRLKADEKDVQDLDQCLTEFECAPYDLSNKALRTLIAGQVASAELQSDFENAHSAGEELVNTFIKERIFRKNSRKSLAKPPTVKTTSTLAIAMDNKAMSKILDLNFKEKILLKK